MIARATQRLEAAKAEIQWDDGKLTFNPEAFGESTAYLKSTRTKVETGPSDGPKYSVMFPQTNDRYFWAAREDSKGLDVGVVWYAPEDQALYSLAVRNQYGDAAVRKDALRRLGVLK